MRFRGYELRIFRDDLGCNIYERKIIVWSKYGQGYGTSCVVPIGSDGLLHKIANIVDVVDMVDFGVGKYSVYEWEDLVEYINNGLSDVENKVINWIINNPEKYVEVTGLSVYSEDIVQYIVENKCEDMPIEWVIQLMK